MAWTACVAPEVIIIQSAIKVTASLCLMAPSSPLVGNAEREGQNHNAMKEKGPVIRGSTSRPADGFYSEVSGPGT
jgi:hypothetical protein